MSRYLFDIEANGLLQDATRMWILVVCNLDTGEIEEFLEKDFEWKSLFDEADLVVGHNIEGYDLLLLEKLFEYRLPKSVQRHDTLLFSQILDYRRFGFDGHSLEAWGRHLGFPKVEHEDWSRFSSEMRDRCITDVKLNIKVYRQLLGELEVLANKAPQIRTYIRSEHYVARWQARAQLKGWPFDIENGFLLMDELEEELAKAKEAIEWKLGKKAIAVDKCKDEVEIKYPKWTQEGCYHSHTATWFKIDPWSGFEGEERLIEGPYCRVKFEDLKLSSPADVKIFLFRNGWEPTTWNIKKLEDGTVINTSPKITEEDLELLGGDGALYRDFTSAESRYGILKTWLENVDWGGNLHGDSMVIGTPSMRMRHQIIVNVPGADSKWGPEMRKLFICPKGWKLIGADSKGNQARGLAHYLGDPEFIDVILNKDIHLYNASKLIDVLNDMGVEHEFTPETLRPRAKRILYAFLFGASGAKLWSYIFGTPNRRKGNKLKRKFTEAVPGFKNLLDKLENIFGSTQRRGYGYIPSLAGNRIYVDSFHKLLVYLLQSAEKITCAAAVMLTMEKLEELDIEYIPCIFMHDEEDFMVREENAEMAAEIAAKAFKDGPELYGIHIMDGDSKIGNNWMEIH